MQSVHYFPKQNTEVFTDITLTRFASCIPFKASSEAQGLEPVPAGVGVEPLALAQTRLRTLPALTQAGVGVQGLVPGALGGAHAAAQLVVPPLAGGTPLPLTLTFALAFT